MRTHALMPVFVLALFDIAQFPAELQPMIQAGYLETSFEDFLEAHNGYWVNADSEVFKEEFERHRGVTITKTRPGLKGPQQVPADPADAVTPPSDGVTPSDFPIEQYTLSPQEFTDGSDMDLITTNFSIVNRFRHYVRNNELQAAQSVDLLARDTFIAGYAVGVARVTASASAGSGVEVSVDDIRGLDTVITVGASSTNGMLKPVSNTNQLPVTIYSAGSGTFTGAIELATADGSNASDFALVKAGTPGSPMSTRGNGVSGTVQIVTLAHNLVAGDIIVAGDAPMQIVGTAGAVHWSKLSSSTDSNLASVQLLDAVGYLRDNAVDYAGNAEGDTEETYTAHLGGSILRSLYNDSDFKQANQTLGQSKVYRRGKVSQYLGVTFLENTNAPKIPLTGGGFANLVIVGGRGAIIDSWYQGLEDWAMNKYNPAYVSISQGIAQILMPAYADRQGRQMHIDWLTIRDMVAPTDVTRSSVVLTGSGSRRTRAVAIWVYSAT